MRDLKHYITLLLFACIALTACQQQTEQEKLEQAMKDNPELVKEWQEKLGEIRIKSQLVPVKLAELPSSLQPYLASTGKRAYYKIDLNLDNQVEIVALESDKKGTRLLLFHLGEQNYTHVQQTAVLPVFADSTTKLSALPGILKMKSKSGNIAYNLQIRFENPTKGFRVIHYGVEEQIISENGKTSKYDLSANFITGQVKETCQQWTDGKADVQTFNSVSVKTPTLESITPAFLTKLRTQQSCK